MEPKVSVIVPVYNAENYIKRCLESIINQTYNNLQIIVVDDGSNDNSRNICEDYARLDNRITVIHKVNGGVSSARNLGMDLADGKYITFVDSDDYIESDMIMKLVTLAIEYEADIVMCGCYKKETDDIVTNKDINTYIQQYSTIEAINDILDKNKFHGYVCNKLFSSDLINNKKLIRFNEDIYVCEDMLFCIECFLNAKKIIYDNAKYYHYVFHGNNTSSKFNDKKLTALDAYDKIFNLIGGNNGVNINRFKSTYVQIVISFMMQNIESKEDIEITNLLRQRLSLVRVSEIMDVKIILAYCILRINPYIFKSFWKMRKKIFN